MNNTMPSYSDYKDTRNYMQDVAKVLGKLQQAYLSKQPHDWHRGVMVDGSSLDSPALEGVVEGQIVSVDYADSHIITPWGEVTIGDKTAADVFTEVAALSPEPITEPEYEDASLDSYDAQHAGKIMQLLDDGIELLDALKQTIASGTTSPILLFPHHFDVSLVWFPTGGDEPQISFGLSTGDDAIEQPYFYVLAWPDHAPLTKLQLPEFASFEQDAFNGILIPVANLMNVDQSNTALATLYADVVALFTAD